MRQVIYIILCCTFLIVLSDTVQQPNSEVSGTYEMIFSDEFNMPNGSRPDSSKWACSMRHKSRWARWISDSSAVAYIDKGKLICRAIPNTNLATDTAIMLTGAIETRNKFYFKYGKVEVRLKTNRYRGNFPAVWMLPQPPCKEHPYGGEIDIFEAYGTNADAYHTAHTHWTLHLKNKNKPQHQFHEQVSMHKWHVYGVEWDERKITWLVDGKIVGVYFKLSDSDALKNGQWPFDHPFYIVINQSVGDHTWPDPPNLKHTYTTYIDWIRVYRNTKE